MHRCLFGSAGSIPKRTSVAHIWVLSWREWRTLGNGDLGTAVTADAYGMAYVTGYTYSSDFPVTPGAFQTTYNGGQVTRTHLWQSLIPQRPHRP